MTWLETMLNPKFGVVISKTATFFFWGGGVKFVLGVQRNIIKESKEISRQHKSIKETEALQALGLKETKVVDATNMKIYKILNSPSRIIMGWRNPHQLCPPKALTYAIINHRPPTDSQILW